MEAHTEYPQAARGSRTRSRILTFMGGLAVGYAAATLLAPKSGREIRSSLSDYAKTTSDSVSSAMRGVIDSARHATRSVGRRMAGGAESPRQAGEAQTAPGGEGAGQKSYQ